MLTNVGGELLLDGAPCREVGVNAYGLLARRWYQPADTQYVQDIDLLVSFGIKIVRVLAIPNHGTTGGGLLTWKTSTGLSAAFYTAQDVVWDYAASKGLQFLVSLFTNHPMVPDAVSETLNALNNPGSASRLYIDSCTTEFVLHYKDHPALAGWNVANEWNAFAELQVSPNSSTYPPPNGLISMDGFTSTIRSIATAIRAAGSAAIITSGNNGCWLSNGYGLEGYMGLLSRINPDPIDTICVHLYSDPVQGELFDGGFEALDHVVNRLKATAADLRKPLILEETGVNELNPNKVKDWKFVKELLEGSSAPALALLWGWYKPGQVLPTSRDDWDMYPGSPRAYQLEVVRSVQSKKPPYAARTRRDVGVPPKVFVRFDGSSCISRSLPVPFSGPFFLSFWARNWIGRNHNYPRVVSATSNEANNGFIINQHQTIDEMYFRLFNTTPGGQSATLKMPPIQFGMWQMFGYMVDPAWVDPNDGLAKISLIPYIQGFKSSPRKRDYTNPWVAPSGELVVGGDRDKANRYIGDLGNFTIVPRLVGEDEIFGMYRGRYPGDALRIIVDDLSEWAKTGAPALESS